MSTTPQDNHQRDASQDADPSRDETSSDPAQIEADIARHRAELGETVDELTERLDVKKQAQHQIEAVKKQATDTVQATKNRANAQLDKVKAQFGHDPENARTRATRPNRQEVTAAAAAVLGVVAVLALGAEIVRRARR